ncbi:MAG: heavy-metal-associated domain-containing protein [Microbacteriaceae bacterium]
MSATGENATEESTVDTDTAGTNTAGTGAVRRHELGLTAKGEGCHCGSAHAPTAAAPASGSADESVWLVEGMTCAHCVRSVTEAISALDGVTGVSIELSPGGRSRVTVAAESRPERARLRAAVEDAGYTLVAEP